MLIVALGTIAINGLAFGLMKGGAHGKRAKPSAPLANIIVMAPESARSNLAIVARTETTDATIECRAMA